jgi:hypothetical protein
MLRQDKLELNTTQFFHGCRVLRSGSPNHVNHRVPHVHLELTTKRLKAFPTKESQRAAPVAAPVEVSQKHFDNSARVLLAAGEDAAATLLFIRTGTTNAAISSVRYRRSCGLIGPIGEGGGRTRWCSPSRGHRRDLRLCVQGWLWKLRHRARPPWLLWRRRREGEEGVSWHSDDGCVCWHSETTPIYFRLRGRSAVYLGEALHHKIDQVKQILEPTTTMTKEEAGRRWRRPGCSGRPDLVNGGEVHARGRCRQ